ncbi:hypothetical protein [Nocardia sp. NPDC057668]|uniref:hypothetical protein n=1 Tax=Nocardia sp. NPDC057668 TaxID=3346202 RepID=UPI003670D42E
MAGQSAVSSDLDSDMPGALPLSGWRAKARRRPMRYRVVVVAPRAADVVRYAGGWLFDHASAGWEVSVLLADREDDRPLEILGATSMDLAPALALSEPEIWPDVIAVTVEAYLADARVRTGVLSCLDSGNARVLVWGSDLPGELAGRLHPAEHRVSMAAQAFKSCALRAAGCPGEAAEPREAMLVGH